MVNKDAIQIWADALEFGDYQQVKSELVRPTLNGDYGFCGLGVACNEYLKVHGWQMEDVERFTLDRDMYSGPDTHLPRLVEEWLGIDVATERKIVRLNDTDEKTLPEIGTWVRENLLKDE